MYVATYVHMCMLLACCHINLRICMNFGRLCTTHATYMNMTYVLHEHDISINIIVTCMLIINGLHPIHAQGMLRYIHVRRYVHTVIGYVRISITCALHIHMVYTLTNLCTRLCNVLSRYLITILCILYHTCMSHALI